MRVNPHFGGLVLCHSRAPARASGKETPAANNFAAAVKFMRDPEKALGHVQPATHEQTKALATAKSTLESIEQSRLHMSFACPLRFPIRSS